MKSAIDDFVVREYHSSDVAGSHGIVIYFFPVQPEFYNDYDHEGYDENNTFMPVDFVRDYDWDDWWKEYYSNINTFNSKISFFHELLKNGGVYNE